MRDRLPRPAAPHFLVGKRFRSSRSRSCVLVGAAAPDLLQLDRLGHFGHGEGAAVHELHARDRRRARGGCAPSVARPAASGRPGRRNHRGCRRAGRRGLRPDGGQAPFQLGARQRHRRQRGIPSARGAADALQNLVRLAQFGSDAGIGKIGERTVAAPVDEVDWLSRGAGRWRGVDGRRSFRRPALYVATGRAGSGFRPHAGRGSAKRSPSDLVSWTEPHLFQKKQRGQIARRARERRLHHGQLALDGDPAQRRQHAMLHAAAQRAAAQQECVHDQRVGTRLKEHDAGEPVDRRSDRRRATVRHSASPEPAAPGSRSRRGARW